MIIAIDFDDTLMDRNNVLDGYKMGQPVHGAITATQKLVEAGNQIVVFTARRVTDPRVYKAVEDWLNHFRIPHHGITNIKRPEFELMIDNRALRFDNWPQTLGDIQKLQTGLPVRNFTPPGQGMIKDITKSLTDPDNQV